MTGKIVLSLSDDEMRRIDEARGPVPRAAWAHEYVRRALDRVSPPRGQDADEKLKKLFQRGRGGYPMPLAEGEYPTIAELAQVVRVAFPPRLQVGGNRIHGDVAMDRHHAERCIWMSWMENTGWPWAEIAREMGYARIDFAQQALSRYVASISDGLPEERRKFQRGTVLKLLEGTLEDWENPGYLHDVKGGLVRNPDGSYARDLAQRDRSAQTVMKIVYRLAQIDGSDPAEAAKIKRDETDYELKSRELLALIFQEQHAIEAEVVSDTDDSVDDQGQDPEQQPGSDEGSPAGPRLDEPGDDRGDEEAQDGEDLQEPVDPGNGN